MSWLSEHVDGSLASYTVADNTRAAIAELARAARVCQRHASKLSRAPQDSNSAQRAISEQANAHPTAERDTTRSDTTLPRRAGASRLTRMSQRADYLTPASLRALYALAACIHLAMDSVAALPSL